MRDLSIKEKQVALFIRDAKSDKEIASLMNLSLGTIQEYVKRVRYKLNASNRVAVAVMVALNPELVGLPLDPEATK